MDPHGEKPNTSMNKTGLSSKDWAKKLEAATGRPVQLGGAVQAANARSTASAEQRTVQFRCAETGKAFSVLLTRYSPSHHFQLVSVSKSPETPPRGHQRAGSGKEDDQQKSFDASDFDWSGWFCPHCGHRHFYQCGTCQEYICGKRVRHLEDGTDTFACHDGCGGTGVVTGCIESFEAAQGHVPAPNRAVHNRLPSATRTLPQAGGHRLPPGPRGGA